MDRKLAWHVQATLERLAALLKTTPGALMAIGVREDLETLGVAMATPELELEPPALEPSTHVSGVWETRQEAETPSVPVDEILKKLR